ncbi:hypothetical protein AB4Z46_22170 [Variovorax sp. M-6]|uniref:hypothetical protein n=1 Tax=Variovorax sp. M-6 TaxID=3233041 RepID=UPI003F97F386
MKKLLALAFLIAAAAGGPTPSLAFNGMQGGSGHGGGSQHNGGGFQHNGGSFHGSPGFHPFHGFGGFPARHAFFARRGFVFVGVPFPVAVNAVGYAGALPVYLYCQNPVGFFPDVQACPTGWLQVSQ